MFQPSFLMPIVRIGEFRPHQNPVDYPPFDDCLALRLCLSGLVLLHDLPGRSLLGCGMIGKQHSVRQSLVDLAQDRVDHVIHLLEQVRRRPGLDRLDLVTAFDGDNLSGT
jgi:hypothetical protein